MNRRGFTFTEVLFAVLLLGVGFIMMAALFPISARQLQNSSTDAVASGIGPAALREIQSVVGPGGAVNLPATNAVTVFPSTIYNQLRANQIMSADPRFGWTAVYRRNTGDDFAQVWVIVARSTNDAVYSCANPTPAPRAVTVTLNFGPPATAAAAGSTDNTGALAAGSYVITANGQVYQLAAGVTGSANTWYLDPGYTLQSAAENLTNATAYILGSGGDGLVQDVAIYCGCISLY